MAAMGATRGEQATYYLHLPQGEQEGPYSLKELREMLQRDLISADTLVSENQGQPALQISSISRLMVRLDTSNFSAR